MTAYEVIPVGTEGLEGHRAVRLDITPMSELVAENERLRTAWRTAHDARMAAENRADKAAKVFSVLHQVFPEMRDLIERARKDIWP